MQTKTIPNLSPEQERRFWARVEVHQPSGCWAWRGAIQNCGYGVVTYERIQYLCHRVAYTMLIGPIPDGMVIDHLCRNPRCVNPDHLQVVTARENHQRRQRFYMTYCKRGHVLQGENIKREARGTRLCRICDNERQRRNYHLRKLRVA